MELTVRITTHDAQGNERVNEMLLEPGAQVPVSEGDRVEIIDSDGWPIEVVVEGDDVAVSIRPETQLDVIIDGVTYGNGLQGAAATFENLARYIEDEEVDSSISFMDPVTEELTVVTSIEDLLTIINTAAGDDVPSQSVSSPGNELEPPDLLDNSDIFADVGVSANEGANHEFTLVDADGDSATGDTEVGINTSGGTLGSEDPVVTLFNVDPFDLRTDPNTGNVDA